MPARARINFIKRRHTLSRLVTRGLITKVFKQINRLCFLYLSLFLVRVCDPMLCIYDDDPALTARDETGHGTVEIVARLNLGRRETK